jgi:hypothetical protein
MKYKYIRRCVNLLLNRDAVVILVTFHCPLRSVGQTTIISGLDRARRRLQHLGIGKFRLPSIVVPLYALSKPKSNNF